MFKELFVVLKAQFSGFIKGVKNLLGITQGAAKKVNEAAAQMEGALTSAFSSQLRNNVSNLSEQISLTKEAIVNAKQELVQLQAQLKKQKEGTKEFKETQKAIKGAQRNLKELNIELAEYNIQARDQKKALADSRLAAEDNSAAIEATSRAVNAATGAILLLGEGNETLKPILKGVSVALAGANTVIAIQNLKLRENQVLLGLSTKAQRLYQLATIGSSAANTAFKTTLALTGLGAALVGLQLLANNYDKIKQALFGLTPEQKTFNKLVEESAKSAQESAKKQAQFATEVKYLKAIVTSNNSSLKAKANAYERLTQLVPELSRYTLNQAVNTGKLNKAIEKQLTLIKLQAEAQALFNTIVSDEQAKIELEANKEAVKGLINELAEYNKLSVGQRMNLSLEEWRQQKAEISGNNNELGGSLTLYEKLEQVQKRIFELQNKANKKESAKVKSESSSLAQQVTNEQEKQAILEVRLNAKRAAALATSEEKRAEIYNAADEEIIRLRKAFFLQSQTAQKASNNKSLEDWKQLQLDQIDAQEKGLKRLQDGRNKDTDTLEQKAIDEALITKEANEGFLKLREEYYQKLKGINAKEFTVGNRTYEQYIEDQAETTVQWLQEKLRITKKNNGDVLAVEQELADAQIALNNAKQKKLSAQEQAYAKNITRIIQSTYQQLANTIANELSTAISGAFEGTKESAALEIEILKAQQKELEQSMNDATKSQLQMLQERKQYLENEQKLAESTQSSLSKLFNGILGGVADFLQQLGVGLIAAALATEAFKETLLKKPLVAAAAGAAAIVAAAGVRAVIARGPKFADGGIVSGPTLGLVGEYPGASTNPEVIAPLNKLKSLIGDTGGSNNGFIAETRISGRDLAIVLNRYNKDLQRG